ncbi:septin-7-like isoform X3 [Babylonia areolata]|uniref:septin-7-like isoform X3 n=1 Tax=Babylonia areolata TaxID=304850 RepID=UPI003FCEF4DF
MSEPVTGSSGRGGPGPGVPDKPPSVAERTRLLHSSFRREEGDKPRLPVNRSQSSASAHAPHRPAPSTAEKPPTTISPPPPVQVAQVVVKNGKERSPPPPTTLVLGDSAASASAAGGKGAASTATGKSSNTPTSGKGPSTPTAGKGSGTPTSGKGPSTPTMGKGATSPTSGKSAAGTTPTVGMQVTTATIITEKTMTLNQPPAASPPINAAKRDAFFRTAPPAEAPTVKFDPSSRFGGHDRERPSVKVEKDPGHMDMEKERERKYGGETRKELEGYVGFANLPNQVYRKSVKKGFEFTLMVVGESGLGKSTLINSLFLTELYSAEYPGPSNRIKKTVSVDTNQTILKENGVQLKLTVVDTPGFGDAVDNSNCWQPITDYIDSKYEEYLNAESRVNRTVMPDTRVHCCLYFIAPTGHGLKPLDVEFMRRLHEKVNIIPLIAKADTLTPDECREFKKTILNEIAQHKIKIYEFPDCDDEEEMKIQKRLRVSDRVPFAVVGSNRVIELGGKRLRGRQYPWGIVEVENLEHNDFIALRNMLIRTHMQDLKDVTNNVHYENFRYNKLAPCTTEGKVKPGSLTKDPLTQMAEERQEHTAKMKKMEAEMEQVFEMKVKEKKQKLKDSEADLQKRSEQMKKSLEQQQREMEDKWKAFEREKATWEEQWGERRRSLENHQKDSKKDKKRLF